MGSFSHSASIAAYYMPKTTFSFFYTQLKIIARFLSPFQLNSKLALSMATVTQPQCLCFPPAWKFHPGWRPPSSHQQRLQHKPGERGVYVVAISLANGGEVCCQSNGKLSAFLSNYQFTSLVIDIHLKYLSFHGNYFCSSLAHHCLSWVYLAFSPLPASQTSIYGRTTAMTKA